MHINGKRLLLLCALHQISSNIACFTAKMHKFGQISQTDISLKTDSCQVAPFTLFVIILMHFVSALHLDDDSRIRQTIFDHISKCNRARKIFQDWLFRDACFLCDFSRLVICKHSGCANVHQMQKELTFHGKFLALTFKERKRRGQFSGRLNTLMKIICNCKQSRVSASYNT